MEELCVDRGGARVLERVSFTLAAGEALGIAGESGSGKSTLARAVTRLIPATSGRVLFRGLDLLALPEAALRAARRELQIVFQDPASSLDPRWTVAESLAEPLLVHRLARGAALQARTRELLQQVELGPELLARHPHELSGGQAQRVALARALATRPALLVADEALSALDPSLRAQMANLLADLRERLGVACLFISHDLRLTGFLCQRIGILSRGQLVELGTPGELAHGAKHPATRALLG